MVVTIEFTSGRMCEYNTSTFCASDPWSETRAGRPVVACEFDLRLDLLMSQGELRLDVIRHALRPEGARVELGEYSGRDGGHPSMVVASRIPTVSMTLASKEEMALASVVYVSSAGAHKPVAWRQGTGGDGEAGWLINGVKFESVRRLYYSDTMMSSTSSAAVKLFRYLRNTLPENVMDEAISEVIGFPHDAIKEVMANEAANADAGSAVVSKDATTPKNDSDNMAPPPETPATSSSSAPYDDSTPLIDPFEFEDDEEEEDG